MEGDKRDEKMARARITWISSSRHKTGAWQAKEQEIESELERSQEKCQVDPPGQVLHGRTLTITSEVSSPCVCLTGAAELFCSGNEFVRCSNSAQNYRGDCQDCRRALAVIAPSPRPTPILHVHLHLLLSPSQTASSPAQQPAQSPPPQTASLTSS